MAASRSLCLATASPASSWCAATATPSATWRSSASTRAPIRSSTPSWPTWQRWTITDLGSSIYGNIYEGAAADYSQIVLADGYTEGDEALFLWEQGKGERKLLFGVPIEQRAEGQAVPLNSIAYVQFTPGGGLLFLTSLFDDRYGLGYFPLSDPAAVRPVEITGAVHTGAGEMDHLEHLTGEPSTRLRAGATWSSTTSTAAHGPTRARSTRPICA